MIASKHTCGRCEEEFFAEDGQFSELDGEFTCDDCAEIIYHQYQEKLMEDGPGLSLQEQQVAAQKLK